MFHSCGRFIGEKVPGRCFEEIQHRCILPVGRVRYVNCCRGTFQHFGESLTGESVDTRIGRRCYCFMSMLTKLVDKFRSNESSATDHYDLHDSPFMVDHAFSKPSVSCARYDKV